MSNLVKVINVRQLDADLLAESPLSEAVDWASDTSSDLPELEGETMRAVLEGLSIGTGDPQETTLGPLTVPTQTSEARVKRMKLTPAKAGGNRRRCLACKLAREESRENLKTTESAVPQGNESEYPKKDSQSDVVNGAVDAGEGPFREHPGILNAPGRR